VLKNQNCDTSITLYGRRNSSSQHKGWKRPFSRPSASVCVQLARSCVSNYLCDFQTVREWIAQDGVRWRALVNSAMNLWVP
jgi:hypothetical protein